MEGLAFREQPQNIKPTTNIIRFQFDVDALLVGTHRDTCIVSNVVSRGIPTNNSINVSAILI